MNYITIVSGLPRSGTSLMMQALNKGGINLLIDGIRTPDQDNPKGYYEFEKVKTVKQDSSWVSGAKGKAVKMVYKLLYDLPKKFSYRVVFMQRDLKEVLVSQKKMLQRKNQDSISEDKKMENLFQKELNKFKIWIEKQDNFSIIVVNYKDIIENPEREFLKINSFLNQDLNVQKMTAVVDPSLYRNRNI